MRFGIGDDEIRFRDPRRFGFIEAIATSRLDDDPRMRRLGPEPFADDCDGDYLHARSRGSRQAIKSFLMDAANVVGVGNIYANEALFLAGIHPLRIAGRVGLERHRRLIGCIRDVLLDAIRDGGTTLRDWHGAEGAEGAFQASLRVYGRSGEPCPRCDAAIRRAVVSGRSTYYCPRCQR